jgi:hypothetical protein
LPVLSLWSFAGAQVELGLRMGGRTDTSSGVPFANRASSWLNSAQMLMARCPIAMPDLEETATITLVSGQAEYSRNNVVPPLTDMIAIQQVQIIDTTTTPVLKQRANRFPFREYRAISIQASSKPTRWTRKGDIIAFDPIPDQAGYEALFDYRKQPQMNGVSIPAEFQEQWIKLAVYLGWASLDQHDKAQQTYAEFPATFKSWLEMPMDDEQWDGYFDPDLAIVPYGWERGWRYSS